MLDRQHPWRASTGPCGAFACFRFSSQESEDGQQEYGLPLVRPRRAGGGAFLCPDLSRQRGGPRHARARRLSVGQGRRCPDGGVHRRRHSLSRPERRPRHPHNHAFSFQIATDDRAETDRLWNAIVGNGGAENVCGWCQDKWGLSWQITPRVLTEALVSPDRAAAKRAFEAMMQMGKIDVAGIEAALRG